jgi:hypothetical protein
MTKKDKCILNYCYEHCDQMWAATIVAIILDCDFRDSKQKVKEFREKDNKGEYDEKMGIIQA